MSLTKIERTKAIFNCLWFGLLPSWIYEKECHYKQHNDQSQVFYHTNDIAQKFKTIKQVFNLSIVEQAKLFDVSRQSVYKWIRGEAHIKPYNLTLLNELEKAALLILKSNYSSILFTEKVILNGLTITELVKEIQDGETAVSLLVDILNREEKEKSLLKSLLDF